MQFNWKDNKKGSKKENIGLIAQDLEKVYPELVSTDKNGMKSVEYTNLVAPLIEAINEQQKEIETLRAEIDNYGSFLPLQIWKGRNDALSLTIICPPEF